MVDSQIQLDLVRQLEQLPLAGQRKVLDYARALAESTPRGTPGKALLSFVGIVTAEDCRTMADAIEAGCEQVDAHEW
jgi:hypothetical protein